MTEFEKWKSRYDNRGCTSHDLQDLYTLKVLTKDEFIQITGLEPTEEVLQPSRFDIVDGKIVELETSNLVNSDMIFISMDALTEINEQLIALQEQLIALQEQIVALKGGVA